MREQFEMIYKIISFLFFIISIFRIRCDEKKNLSIIYNKISNQSKCYFSI